MDAKLKVVNPAGETVANKTTPLAARLDTLNGKTVCQIWNSGFKADTMFPIIEEMLVARYPGVKVIPYTEFPAVAVGTLDAARKEAILEAVRAALVEKGCEAVITGNGG